MDNDLFVLFVLLCGDRNWKVRRILGEGQAPVPTAMARPCEAMALSGATEAAKRGLIVPLLVGPTEGHRDRGRRLKLIRRYDGFKCATNR